MGQNNVFSFMDYDVIGFDLDNCLCRYNITELLKLEYDFIAGHIISQNRYPTESLSSPCDQGHDFALQGLILDMERGNMLRITEEGRIAQASHGTREMSKDEIEEIYPEGHWELTDQYAKDPLTLWEGPDAMRMTAATDYFRLCLPLLFARFVDDMDASSTKPTSYNIFNLINESLMDHFEMTKFQTNEGAYYPPVKSNPNKFIIKYENDTIRNWLKELRSKGKKLFLLSNSNIDYATLVADTALGPNWEELFDIKIFKAKKPGFWNLQRPFKTTDETPFDKLELYGNFLEGNFPELNKFLSIITNQESPKILYLGDNVVQDVFAPKKYSSVDAIAIIEELEAEGMYGYDKIYTKNTELLRSKFWGSFFAHKDDSDSIWKSIVKKYAKLVAPSIEALAKNPVDFLYMTQHLD